MILLGRCLFFSFLLSWSTSAKTSASGSSPPVLDLDPRGQKALVVSLPIGWSHVQFQCGVAQWLSEAGYEVHMLIAQFKANKTLSCAPGTNVTKTFHYDAIDRVPDKLSYLELGFKPFITSGFAAEGMRDVIEACRALFDDEETMHLLQAERYSLGVAEFFNFCMYGALAKIGISNVIVSSATPFQSRAAYEIGLPAMSSITPRVDEFRATNGNFAFHDRVWNLYVAAYEHFYSFAQLRAYEDLVLREYFPDGSVTTATIKKSWNLFVTNTNKFVDFSRLQTAKMVYIGGGMVRKSGKLSSKLIEIFEKRSKGIIYISFGTIAETSRFPDILRKSLRAAILTFTHYEFIWKVSGPTKDPEFDDLINLHMVNWVDQSAVLAHPKTVAFYTHCGLNSFNEAAVFGVPLVGTPVFGDQHYNGAILEKRQLGIQVVIENMSPETLIAAFSEVLSNPVYRKNMQIIARKIERDPHPPKESFIRWARYLSHFNETRDLDLDSVDMDFVKFYSLDVILSLFLIKAFILGMALRFIMNITRTRYSRSMSPLKYVV